MNQACGNTMADLLDISGGAEALEKIVNILAAAEHFRCAQKCLGEFTAGTALAVYAGRAGLAHSPRKRTKGGSSFKATGLSSVVPERSSGQSRAAETRRETSDECVLLQ